MRAGNVVRIRGQRWRVARCTEYESTAVLEVGGCDSDNHGLRTRFLLAAERVELLPASDVPRRVSRPRWRRIVRRLLADAVPGMQSLRGAALARIALIPFQLEPALAVTTGLGTRLLIADEVGLGKTIQAGLIVSELLHRHPDGHVLVVSPAFLREQWADELHSRFELTSTTLDARSVMRAASQGGPDNPWATSSLVITSIDYVKRPEVLRSLEALVWDAVVFDEAHALAGTSERAAAAASLATRARIVVLLSATPHSGDDQAFARLCGVGRLAGDDLLVFRRTREDAGLSSTRRTKWLRVRTTAAELAMHRALMVHARLVWSRAVHERSGARLAMMVLLKRACSSPVALARSLERRLHLLGGATAHFESQPGLPFENETADGEPWAALSTPGLDDRDEEQRQLRSILELATAAAAADSKMRTLSRFLGRIREPAIVFTEYRDTLVHVGSLCPGAVQLHGGLTAAERRDALSAFASGTVRLLLATDAASEGLNLHERCRLVVNLELPWTPSRLEQRVGRVDRLGQTARVHAVHMVGAGTPEEQAIERLLRRDARARRALAARAPASDEHAVARAVLETPESDSRTAAPASTPSPEPGVAFPRLFEAAREEAGRLECVRRLAAGAAPLADNIRPVFTRFGRHDRRRRSYWAVRVAFVDSAGQVAWSTIAAAEVLGPGTPPDRQAIRGTFEAVRGWLETAAHHRRWGMPSHAVEHASAWTRTALHREREIARYLEDTRARLAVFQPGLFDRRQERERDAQQAVLDHALQQCAVRTLGLQRLEHLSCGALEPLFAVLGG